MTAISAARLKRTDAFGAVYRRGRWARGAALSVGILPNGAATTRVGLRTRRGMKGAVVRNRLKRQVRAIVHTRHLPLRPGLDIVIVIHPKTVPTTMRILDTELRALCQKISALL